MPRSWHRWYLLIYSGGRTELAHSYPYHFGRLICHWCYTFLMTVQTIPEIDKMTAAQQIELMEALWQNMSERHHNSEPPDWHREYLLDREEALAKGDDSFISLDEFEADLRKGTK